MKIPKNKTQRGRPRCFDRSLALKTAMELFWRQGYESTSVSELTEAMGITPPSLYAAFGSKTRLFMEAVEFYDAEHGHVAMRALIEEPTARKAIERLLLETAAAFTDPTTPHGCLIVTAATNCSLESAEVEAALRKRRKATEHTIRERMERARAEGDLPEETDIAELVKFYAALIQGMSLQARDGATKEELESIARLAMKIWPSMETAEAHNG